MSLDNITNRPLSKWMEATGPSADIVLSSRVRLARNIEGIPFPHLMNDEQTARVMGLAEEGAKELNRYGFLGRVELFQLSEVSPLERQVLVEKHLISPQQAREVKGKAVAISEDETVSIMVNEEDHLRIQCLFSGLQLAQAWELANRVDDALEGKINFAFSERRGYLTACPTNAGTGIRASVMMHLPALVMTNQAPRVFHTINQLGLAIRGLYGEGTEAKGNIFQVSNQITLGRSEEDIVAHLNGVVTQLIDHERQARAALQKEAGEQLEDRIGRAHGILSSARIMTSDEAMKLISDVRLGIDLGIITNVSQKAMNELLVVTRPAYLQKLAGRELSPFDRDLKRAALIRSKINPAAAGYRKAGPRPQP